MASARAKYKDINQALQAFVVVAVFVMVVVSFSVFVAVFVIVVLATAAVVP
jgi:hypothetical protein